MARTGDRFELPDGSVFELRRSAADTGGEFVEATATLAPGTFTPPPHVHPRSADRFEVVDGRFDILIHGRWRTLGPGEGMSVPAGTLHTIRNSSEAPVTVNNVHRPAVRFEDFLEHLHRLSRQRGIANPRDPRVRVLFAMLMLEYPDTVAFGRLRERVGARALATVGRAIGMSTG